MNKHIVRVTRGTYRRLFAACLLLPIGLHGQQATRGPVPVASALSSIKVGTTVRIANLSGAPTIGKMVRLDTSAIWIELERAPMAKVPFAAIDSLWTQQRYTGHGILIGALTSTVLLSVWACQPSCAESGVVWPGLVITPIPGILVGAIVGHNIKRWTRRFPR